MDAFDTWLELEAKDRDGRVIFWSGRVEQNGKGPVEPGAHFYRSYQLDAEGNPINKRNAWQSRSLLYARLIPPGAADVAHFRIKIPKDAKGPISLTARVNYRKFAHYYTQFAYAGEPKPNQDPSLLSLKHNSLEYSFDAANIPKNVSGEIKDRIPDLPIVVVAEARAEMGIGEPVWNSVAAKPDRERWNDWGIGLLLQGDLKGAEYAFRKVTEAEPEYADGWLNVARALIQEGETDAAKPFIAKALAADPKLGRTYYFKALIEKADGDYDAALVSLRTAESMYPRDRVVLNQMARILFLKKQYAEALRVLERVCLVDPEDLQMHYTMMLCYRGLGDAEKAAREEKLFRRFKADESSQAITGRRRHAQPGRQQRAAADSRSRKRAGGWGRRVKALWIVLPGLILVVLAAAVAPPEIIQFTDVSEKAGIRFTHNSGRAGKKFLPETLGAGAAFFDADGDGWPDILLINSKDWTPRGRKSLSALYRNNHNGTFTNITAGSGLDVEMYGMGVAIGDYDNDGRDDVYITALEGDRLFHNEGGGKFRDVTAASGIRNANFGTSAAWLDYDRDGKLDLFVANYVQWTPKGDLWCSLDGATKSYCTPESYKGTSSKLFHNLGGGKFEDVSQKAGVGDPTSKSLGVSVFDYNSDGWPDIFVANDTQPNKLYRNNRNGTFTEEAVGAGVAFGEDGVARGAMGADAADYDRSGRPHLLVGNFSNQMLGLYHNEGTGLFVDEAPSSTVGRASLLTLSFGVFFFDFDLDGYPDIFAANGHIEEEIGRVQPKVQYKEPPLLFRNLGQRRFDNVTGAMGAALSRPIVARGAAYADFDRDGDLDLLISTNHGPAYLYRNDGGNRNHWLSVKLVGSKSNRDGIGAVVRIESASGKQWNTVHSGGSYCSQSDLALTFGLGKDATVATLDIEWPSGTKQRLTALAANQFLTIEEGKGITAKVGPGGK